MSLHGNGEREGERERGRGRRRGRERGRKGEREREREREREKFEETEIACIRNSPLLPLLASKLKDGGMWQEIWASSRC